MWKGSNVCSRAVLMVEGFCDFVIRGSRYSGDLRNYYEQQLVFDEIVKQKTAPVSCEKRDRWSDRNGAGCWWLEP